MDQTKITVKIYKPLLRDFDRQIDSLFIKRDAFLNNIVRGQVHYLSRDLEGKRMSSDSKRYVSGQLKRMGTVAINVVVDKSTADALNEVVERTNIVRDAFFNRLILFLRSSDALLNYLDLPKFVTPSGFSAVVDPMPTSPMKAMEEVQADPLFYLREAVSERYQTGLYLIDLPRQLMGFSCYLEESKVPGTEAHAQAQREAAEADAMLDELLSFEADAFRKPATVKGAKP